jgi:selenocysteine lyase/cysteine desulfurase
MEPDFKALRREFPLLQHMTYLNSCSYCALANDVKAAFDNYLLDRLQVGANWDVWVTKNEAVRALMAQLLHATPDEIAVTASASAGLNALATALQFSGERNKVVISDFEFPTNAQIWHAQEQRGARVVHVKRNADGYIPPEAFVEHIDEQTKLVAITHVCFRNGARLDIGAVAKLARAKGALVLLDCYQSVGSVDIDVKALDVDFAVGGMLKYLLGTAGIGFLYVRDSLVRSLHPTHTGWFAQENIFAMAIDANRRHAAGRELLCLGSRVEDHARCRNAGDRAAHSRADAKLHGETARHRLGERHALAGRAARCDDLRAIEGERRTGAGTDETQHRRLTS